MNNNIVKRKAENDPAAYIEDYIVYRLRKENIDLPRFRHVKHEPFSPIAERLRSLGDELESLKHEFFHEACLELGMDERTAYPKFVNIAEQLFSEGLINWGRIAVFIAFSGHLALHFATTGMECMVPSIIGWTTRYMSTHVVPWMDQHGGWDGFREYFRNDNHLLKKESDWVGTALTTAAVAVGLWAVGKVLQR